MLVTGHDDKAKIIDDFYIELLGTSKDQDYTVNPNDLSIGFGDLADLDAPFSEQVWKTICQLWSDKAPGPGGFAGRFYKTCWLTLKEDTNSQER